MSTYTHDSTGLWQSEINLYGSTRIGIHKYALNLTVPDPIPIITIGNITGKKSIFERGNKLFETNLIPIHPCKILKGQVEMPGYLIKCSLVRPTPLKKNKYAVGQLTNHLGNVNVVVNDRKKPVPNTGNPLLLSKYMPVVVSAQDYYPFGMIMPQRSFSSELYRYGFNGKENDNEVKGTGNQQDYGERIYDTRVGRFLSVDPLTKSYPMLTPYQYASNSPIWMIDLDGLEGIKFSSVWNGRANIVQFVNDPDVGGTIMEGTESFNRNFNFVFSLVNYGYKFGTGHDYDGNAIDSRGKSGVAADMGVEAMQWLTLGRFFKALPNASTPIEQKMAQNARAAGTPPAKPTQSKAMAAEAEGQPATTAKPQMQPAQMQQQAQQWQAKHHIATNKNSVSTVRGGPWTPQFEPFFKNAGLDINKAPANLVDVVNHAGPHPEAYHKLVFTRLTEATSGIRPNTDAYKAAVTNTLQAIGKEAQTTGSSVNKLITSNK